MSENWQPKPVPTYALGEVHPDWYKWSNGRTPPTARGLHWFGPPEFFARGQPWNPDAPPVPRDPFGLAVACTGMPPPELVEGRAIVGLSTEGGTAPVVGGVAGVGVSAEGGAP